LRLLLTHVRLKTAILHHLTHSSDVLPYSLVGSENDSDGTETIVGFLAIDNKPNRNVMGALLEQDKLYKESHLTEESAIKGLWARIIQEQYHTEGLKVC
jgi:hypothetical protein